MIYKLIIFYFMGFLKKLRPKGRNVAVAPFNGDTKHISKKELKNQYDNSVAKLNKQYDDSVAKLKQAQDSYNVKDQLIQEVKRLKTELYNVKTYKQYNQGSEVITADDEYKNIAKQINNNIKRLTEQLSVYEKKLEEHQPNLQYNTDEKEKIDPIRFIKIREILALETTYSDKILEKNSLYNTLHNKLVTEFAKNIKKLKAEKDQKHTFSKEITGFSNALIKILPIGFSNKNLNITPLKL